MSKTMMKTWPRVDLNDGLSCSRLEASRSFGHNWLNEFIREMACVSVQIWVAQGSIWRAQGHALCSVEYGFFLSATALQKAKLLCTAFTRDTHSVIVLGHAATDGHSS